MVINSPCYCNEELASPQQTAHCKDISNPLIAGSLLKTMLRAVRLKSFSFHCSLSVKIFFHCQFTVTTASANFTSGELAVATVVSVRKFLLAVEFNRFSRGLFLRIIYLLNLFLSLNLLAFSYNQIISLSQYSQTLAVLNQNSIGCPNQTIPF